MEVHEIILIGYAIANIVLYLIFLGMELADVIKGRGFMTMREFSGEVDRLSIVGLVVLFPFLVATLMTLLFIGLIKK